MRVDFLDLRSQYLSIKPEIDKAIESVFNNSAFVGGPMVNQFEENFAAKHHAKYCIAVNTGTSALHVMLTALKIGTGDEVIVPVNTCFATAEAVSLTGATPKFTECDKKYFNLDPARIEQAITDKTKAILVVHLYGQPAQMNPIIDIARKHDLLLLEDCAQAHLATYKDTFVGNFGIAGSFSFYPTKNLGAFGQGGAVITNDKTIHDKIQAIKNHGSSQKYYHHLIGHNYRMSGIQGAILNVKLDHIDKWTAIRRNNAQLYNSYLSEISEIVLPEKLPNVEHSYHLYVIRVPNRTRIQQYLTDKEIHTGIHYPVPCHLQAAYQNLGYSLGSFPISEQYAQEVLSLPMSEQLKEEEIEYVAHQIRSFFN